MPNAEQLVSQPFESFKPFINTQGLPTGLTPELFINLLQKLHSNTGNLWEGGKCFKSTSITLQLNALLKTSENKIMQAMKANTFIYLWQHSWTEIPVPDGKIIVDPFGELETNTINHRFVPYFGVLKNLDQSQSPTAWITYNQGRQLSQYEEALMFFLV